MMTAYLWHMPALFVVTGVVVVGMRLDTPTPGGAFWLAGWPIWLTLLGLTMWPLLKGFARFEEPLALPYGKATWSSALVATGLVAGGVLALTVAGFAPGLTPVLAALAILGGLLVTGPRAQL
jgi:hypothetical protein